MTDFNSLDTIRVRMTLDVTYVLNGEDPNDILMRLHKRCEHAIDNGLLTGETAASVELCQIDEAVLPEPLSEDELARFMLQRIEDGDLLVEDVPTRLARYGLMEPGDFVSEMRERMDEASED